MTLKQEMHYVGVCDCGGCLEHEGLCGWSTADEDYDGWYATEEDARADLDRRGWHIEGDHGCCNTCAEAGRCWECLEYHNRHSMTCSSEWADEWWGTLAEQVFQQLEKTIR